MNKFLLSKIIAIFFGITTVILFVLSREGMLFEMAGSIEAGMIIYFVNAFFLVVSLVVFIWQRARKDLPRKQESTILEAYSEVSSDDMGGLSSFPIQDDQLQRLKSSDETIRIKSKSLHALQPGDSLQLFSLKNNNDRINVVVISNIDSNLSLRREIAE